MIPAPQLLALLESRLAPSLELLRTMVAVNSFTANREGVNLFGHLTAESFAALGFTPEFVPSQNPAYGDHLVLTRPGRGGKTLGFISHLDTVYPPEEEQRNQFFWRPEGERIYGPGTDDIKGGTVMMHLVLWALRALTRETFDATTWVLLLDASEETLSDDFGRLCLKRLAGAEAALVFEGGRREGQSFPVVTARKGRGTFRLTVEGRGAHAGSEHVRGANAVVQLAHLVGRIATLTDYARGLTFNVGTVSGGTVIDRVPHQAVAELEMRAFDPAAYQAGLAALLALGQEIVVRAASDAQPCRIRFDRLSETPPWPRNPGTEKLLALWGEAGAALGFTVPREERGGVSDGNFLCHALPTLDGLGPKGDNSHCSERSADGSKEQEYVEPASFVPKAALNVLAIQSLLQAAR